MPESIKQDAVVARNEKVVRRFIDAWAALDVDAAMACIADNIVYINQPLEPVVGSANVRKIIQGILERTRKVEWKLLNVFGRGNIPARVLHGAKVVSRGRIGKVRSSSNPATHFGQNVARIRAQQRYKSTKITDSANCPQLYI